MATFFVWFLMPQNTQLERSSVWRGMMQKPWFTKESRLNLNHVKWMNLVTFQRLCTKHGTSFINVACQFCKSVSHQSNARFFSPYQMVIEGTDRKWPLRTLNLSHRILFLSQKSWDSVKGTASTLQTFRRFCHEFKLPNCCDDSS